MAKVHAIVCILLATAFLCSVATAADDQVVPADQFPLKCCYDNHIGSCIPGQPGSESVDDKRCADFCRRSGCTKPEGGRCKVFGWKSPPNHFCHCYC